MSSYQKDKKQLANIKNNLLTSTSSSVATLINEIINEQNSCKASKDSVSRSDAQVVHTNQNQTYRLISSLNQFSSSLIKIEDSKSQYPPTPSDINDEIVIKATDTIREISNFKMKCSKGLKVKNTESKPHINPNVEFSKRELILNNNRLNNDSTHCTYKKNIEIKNETDTKLSKSKSSYILPKANENEVNKKAKKNVKPQNQIKTETSSGVLILPLKKSKAQVPFAQAQKLISSKSMKSIKDNKSTKNEELIKMILNRKE